MGMRLSVVWHGSEVEADETPLFARDEEDMVGAVVCDAETIEQHSCALRTSSQTAEEPVTELLFVFTLWLLLLMLELLLIA